MTSIHPDELIFLYDSWWLRALGMETGLLRPQHHHFLAMYNSGFLIIRWG